jgi:Cys-tRNA(Pro)/Cys-tRNA(Cys) deacylase
LQALHTAGIDHRVHTYPAGSDGAWGPEAVTYITGAVGAEPEQIFKTLVFDVAGNLAVAVIPVPSRLSLKSAAAALRLGGKAAMAEPKDVMRVTGYVLGGVSPIGQRKRLPTVVDETAELWPVVFCSAGKRGLEIELSPADLITATGATVADITA